MVKAELVARVAAKRGLKITVAQKAVDAVFDSMAGALVEGDRIEVRGFASFAVKHYPGREGRDPRTGGTINIFPRRGVAFKLGADLRQRVNRVPRGGLTDCSEE